MTRSRPGRGPSSGSRRLRRDRPRRPPDRGRGLARRVRAAGARLLGPNCLGLFDADSDLRLTSDPLPAGRVALLSQSGNLSLDLAGLLVEHGLGFSRFVSAGNQADIELPELIEACAEHAATDVIAIYCEQFTDGRRFVEAARSAGKPVVAADAPARAPRRRGWRVPHRLDGLGVRSRRCRLRRSRRSSGSTASASSRISWHCWHPRPGRPVAGSRFSPMAAAMPPLPRSWRTARVSIVPVLSDPLRARIAGHLPSHAGTSNPVDVAGGAEQDLYCIPRVAADLLEPARSTPCWSAATSAGTASTARSSPPPSWPSPTDLADIVDRHRPPVAVHTMFPAGPMAARLRARGLAVFRRVESATVGLGRLHRPLRRAVADVPPTPEARRSTRLLGRPAAARRRGRPVPAGAAGPRRGRSRAGARQLAAPWALKANGLLHKSDAGGVRLGLRTVTDLVAAYRDLVTAAGAGRLCRRGAGRCHRRGRAHRRRTPRPALRPVAMVGIGGIFTELLDDAQVDLAPARSRPHVAAPPRLRVPAAGRRSRPQPRRPRCRRAADRHGGRRCADRPTSPSSRSTRSS